MAKSDAAKSDAARPDATGPSGSEGSLFSAWRKARWLLALIVAFSLLSKSIRLGWPEVFYFDEVYHGFAATRLLHADKDAYNPWANPPPGRAYAWDHPPLAKLIIAGSMGVVGENSVGWRLGSVVFGSGVVALTGELAMALFGSVPAALLAAGLVSIEGLVFVQSRMAMNDVFFIFFMMLTLLAYCKWKQNPYSRGFLYLIGLGVGLAVATKWTGFYLILILMIDLFGGILWTNKAPRGQPIARIAFALLVIPVFVYLASYAQYFILGYGWKDFWELQRQMWFYHTGTKQTHSYSSVPWQWLLNLRPVWMHVDYGAQGKVANIYNLGNSVILLSGLLAAYHVMFKEKGAQWSRWFILLAYFMMWLPWSFSPRIMLFYHYAPAVPLLCILLGRFLDRKLRDPERGWRFAAYGILAGSLAWFVLFYPHLTGIHVPRGFAETVYFLIPSWR